jgi:CO/xanthine dehydrogenase Mo-binding subunit
MSDTRYVGKPATRVDALEKVLGTAKYVGDYHVPGMVYARALRSTWPHARIIRVDVTPSASPGVLAAITGDDFVDHGALAFLSRNVHAGPRACALCGDARRHRRRDQDALLG